jgi:hypothetical protein
MSDYLLRALETFKHPEGKWYYIARFQAEDVSPTMEGLR